MITFLYFVLFCKFANGSEPRWAEYELGTSGIFKYFHSLKMIFAFFIKLNWLGVGFLNRTGAEIGY